MVERLTRLIAQVGPVPIPHPGILVSEIRYKKKLLGGWPIVIQKAGDEMLLGLSGVANAQSSTRVKTKPRKKSAKKSRKAKK